MKQRGIWGAVFTFVGVVVGAGILGLPYVFSRVGFVLGLILLVLMSGILLYSNLIVGEVIQRTKGKHQLAGLVERYLGRRWRYIIGLVIIIGLFSALVGYCIAAGQIVSSLVGGVQLIYSILFWAIFSFLILFSTNMIKEEELVLSGLKLIACFLIGLFFIVYIDSSNLAGYDLTKVFPSLGILMFALLGVSIVPVVNMELRDKKMLKSALVIGSLLSLAVYIVFTTALVGIMGISTPEIATTGLEEFGKTALVLVNLFALLAVASAFIGLGFTLKRVFMDDFKLKNLFSWLIVSIVTLIVVLLKPISFLKAIGLSGSIGGGLVFIILFYVHSRAIRRGEQAPSYKIRDCLILKLLISILFVFIVLNEIFGFFSF